MKIGHAPVKLAGANSSRARARRRLGGERWSSGVRGERTMLWPPRRWRRGARRWCATAPPFNNCVEVAYGIARFAEREAVESDGHTRSTCGVRELRDSPVRRSVRQWH